MQYLADIPVKRLKCQVYVSGLEFRTVWAADRTSEVINMSDM